MNDVGTRQILITRVFDAPRDRVFDAWTDPAQVAAWYGPADYDVPRDRVHVDLRVGGRYELAMVPRGDGADHLLVFEIVELDPPRLLVLQSEPAPGFVVQTRVELHDHGEKTRLTLTDGPFPERGADGAERAWNAALDALAAHAVVDV